MVIATNTKQMIYNEGTEANPSSVGKQWNVFAFDRKTLIEAADEAYFGQLSSTTNMPKHHGKTIKKQIFYPILSDKNVNDQGINAEGVQIANGNLYGSSKDTGSIISKMPLLSEYGGRVNRVGYHRDLIEGSIQEYGFFYEITQDAIDFDSDAELIQHMRREALIAAHRMNEDALQADLLNGAGTVVYGGAATSVATITGEGDDVSEITYTDLMKADILLNNNRTPKSLKFISGSRMTDTKVIASARAMFIGSELEIQMRDLRDNFSERAFIPVEKYAAAGNLLKGEIGAIGPFRLISVTTMQHSAGAGATATAANKGYRTTEVGGTEKYDVYPMVVIGGEDSYGAPFTHIGFQSSGTSNKFKIATQLPSIEKATLADPFGKTGFSSIAWHYGILLERTERILKLLSVAKL